jgi:hypothetical protein
LQYNFIVASVAEVVAEARTSIILVEPQGEADDNLFKTLTLPFKHLKQRDIWYFGKDPEPHKMMWFRNSSYSIPLLFSV